MTAPERIQTSEAQYIRLDLYHDVMREIERAHALNTMGKNQACSELLRNLVKNDITKP